MIRSSGVRSRFAAELIEKKKPLAEYVTERMYESPYWAMRYGPKGRVACVRDLVKTIEICAAAMRNGSPMLIDQHTPWLRGILVDLGMSTVYLLQALGHMQEHTAELLSPEAYEAFQPVFISGMQAITHTDVRSQKLTAQVNQITAAVIRDMHTVTPFWQARYGADAVRLCSIDINYLFHYLVDALALDTKKGLLDYLPWIRKILSPRMLTTAYFLDELKLLSEAMKRILTPQEAAPLDEIVSVVENALSYSNPTATLLANEYERIVSYCVQQHYQQTPLLMAALSEEQYRREIWYRLSYLMDAYGQETPSLFTNYVMWVGENIERFKRTHDEYWTDLEQFVTALPSEVGLQVQAWLLGEQTAVLPTATSMATTTWAQQAGIMVQALWKRLHHNTTFWSQLLPANEKVAWRGILETAVLRLEANLASGDLSPTVQWLTQQARGWGASDAYALSFLEQLEQIAGEQLTITQQASVTNGKATTIEQLKQASPVITVIEAPNLVPWIQQQLLDISPYWQANYQRRDDKQIANDIRILLGMIVDVLPQVDTSTFFDQINKQHHYLLSQGICTAFYQQLLTFTADALEVALDPQSKARGTTLLYQAIDQLGSDQPEVALLIDHQDAIAETALKRLRQTAPQLEKSYPHGWEDAFVDLIYWLAYLSDAVAQKRPNLLMSYLLWYHSFVRENQLSGDLISETIQALHIGLEQHLGDEAKLLVGMLPKVKMPASKNYRT